MKNFFLITFFLIIISQITFSQPTKNDSLVCDLLLKKLKNSANQANDSAIDYYGNLLSYARHHKIGFYIAESINTMGIYFSNKGQYAMADLYFKASEKIFNLLKSDVYKASLYINMANLLTHKEDYIQAIEIYKKAYTYAERFKDTSNIGKINSNISRCYYIINDYKNAEQYALKSIKSFGLNKDSLSLANSYNNLGAILDKLNKKQEALKAYYNAKRIYSRSHINAKLVSTLNNIGNTYKDLNQFDSALYYMQSALSIKRKIGNKKSICISLGNLSELYIQINMVDKAENLATEMLNIANQINNKTQQMYANYYLYQIYKKKGNCNKALNFFENYFVLYDSLNNIDFKERIDKMMTQMQVESKDLKIEKLVKEQKLKDTLIKNQKTELKNKQLWTYFYLFIILILILIISFAHYIMKTRVEKKQNFLENQMLSYRIQSLTHQINPHFIFNILNSIQYNVNQNDSQTTNKYITNFSKLLRMILENSQQQTISLLVEMESLKLYLELEQMRIKNKFSYKIVKKSDFNPIDYMMPPLLLQPFVENAIWHGIMNLEEGQNGCIEILLTEYTNYLCCEIIDNGIGYNNLQHADKHVSRGIEITRKRIETFNKLYKTNLEVEVSNIENHPKFKTGTKVKLTIPKIDKKSLIMVNR